MILDSFSGCLAPSHTKGKIIMNPQCPSTLSKDLGPWSKDPGHVVGA